MSLLKYAFCTTRCSCYIQTRTAQEVFDSYDLNKDGYWDQNEQWRMLKDLFRGLTLEEHHELFDKLQVGMCGGVSVGVV
jgi:Ca2+-binding EF-hand superfamily protein